MDLGDVSVKNFGNEKDFLTALAVTTMLKTAERVGNNNSASEKGHFGVTGFKKNHKGKDLFERIPYFFIFNFPG